MVAAFSNLKNESYIVSASADSTVRIWKTSADETSQGIYEFVNIEMTTNLLSVLSVNYKLWNVVLFP